MHRTLSRAARLKPVAGHAISEESIAERINQAENGPPVPQPSRLGKVECLICHGLLPKEDWKARYKHANEHAIELQHRVEELEAQLERAKKLSLVIM